MKKHLLWVLPLLLLAPFTPKIDLFVSGLFYSEETGFYNNSFFRFLFHYGEIFGLATGALAVFIFAISFVRKKWEKWRRGAFVIMVTLILGAGILTNVLFKEYWGRPRPKEIEQFGGKHTFHPFWKPKFHSGQKSFPSGHVAMGFYFLSLCFVGKREKNSALFATGVVLTIGLGGGLIVTRVVQGGHFFTDVMVSPILMWFVALYVTKFAWTESGARFLHLKPQRLRSRYFQGEL